MRRALLSTLMAAAILSPGCDTDDASTTPGDTAPDAQVFEACEGQSFTITEPVEGYAWTPNAITLVSEPVAEGVFAVYDQNAEQYEPAGYPLATTAGFVIGTDGVLLVETMINRQLFCQLIDLVQAETDLPIRYAVNTSYHGDHSFGNAFLPDDVTIVQHASTASYIGDHFEEDVAFMEAGFGADQGIDEVTPVAADVTVDAAGWSVDLGGLTVEAQYHGFAQTVGDLFVYVPEANVLWTGNPLIAAPPAIPWLLDGHAHEVGTTLAAVQASLPAGAVVIPGHGRPTTAAGFDFSISYLDTLLDEVGAAVDAGQTEAEAMKSVTMKDHQGYALWGWVHTTINVPWTYAELSQ